MSPETLDEVMGEVNALMQSRGLSRTDSGLCCALMGYYFSGMNTTILRDWMERSIIILSQPRTHH
jgi:hypothetical protein